jgi:predicted HicB family RNase H-like nuclease
MVGMAHGRLLDLGGRAELLGDVVKKVRKRSKYFYVRVTDKFYATVVIHAHKSNMSAAEYIREAIKVSIEVDNDDGYFVAEKKK